MFVSKYLYIWAARGIQWDMFGHKSTWLVCFERSPVDLLARIMFFFNLIVKKGLMPQTQQGASFKIRHWASFVLCVGSFSPSRCSPGRKKSWRGRWIEGEQRRSTRRRPKRNIWLKSTTHEHIYKSTLGGSFIYFVQPLLSDEKENREIQLWLCVSQGEDGDQ